MAFKDHKTAISITTLIVAPLVGLIPTWFWSDWSKKAKILITTLVVIFYISAVPLLAFMMKQGGVSG